jgi:hypothetical protein
VRRSVTFVLVDSNPQSVCCVVSTRSRPDPSPESNQSRAPVVATGQPVATGRDPGDAHVALARATNAGHERSATSATRRRPSPSWCRQHRRVRSETGPAAEATTGADARSRTEEPGRPQLQSSSPVPHRARRPPFEQPAHGARSATPAPPPAAPVSGHPRCAPAQARRPVGSPRRGYRWQASQTSSGPSGLSHRS